MKYIKVVKGEIPVTPCPFCGTGKTLNVSFVEYVTGLISVHPKMAQGQPNIRSGFKMVEAVEKAKDIWVVEDTDYDNLIGCYTPDQRTGLGQLSTVLIYECKTYFRAIDEATDKDPRIPEEPDPPEDQEESNDVHQKGRKKD